MIKRASEHKHDVSSALFSGSGDVIFDRIIETPAELMGKGRVFSVTTLPAGSELGRHVHNGDCEFYHILSGSAEYNDNGNVVTISAGDVTYTGDGEGHGLVNNSDEPFEMIALILFEKQK